jgi:hypothetical protein
MVQSTVGSSIANAIGIIGQRPEREAALAEQLLQNQTRSALLEDQRIKNEASRQGALALQNGQDLAVLYDQGYVNFDGGSINVSGEYLATDPDAAMLFFRGDENFLSTNGVNGSEGVSFKGFQQVPGGYAIRLGNKAGEIVPATRRATPDSDDEVIVLSGDELNRLTQSRAIRMVSQGSLNNPAMKAQLAQNLFLPTPPSSEQSPSELQDNPLVAKLGLETWLAGKLQQGILDQGEDVVAGDPVAQRDYYAMAGATDDLNELRTIAADVGVDVDALEAQGREEWGQVSAEAQNASEAQSAASSASEPAPRAIDTEIAAAKARVEELEGLPPGRYRTQSLNAARRKLASLEREAQTADADADESLNRKARREETQIAALDRYIAAAEKRLETAKALPPGKRRNRAIERENQTINRQTEKRDERMQRLAELRGNTPAAQPAQPPQTSTGVPPSSAYPGLTVEEIREAIQNKVGAPTPQEAQQVAEYAQSQGVNTIQDLAKLPAPDARQIAAFIAFTYAGDPTEQLAVFDRANNFVTTGSPSTSADDVTRTQIAAGNASISMENTKLRAAELRRNLLKDQSDLTQEQIDRRNTVVDDIIATAQEIGQQLADASKPLKDQNLLANVQNFEQRIRSERDPEVKKEIAGFFAETLGGLIRKQADVDSNGFFGWFANLGRGDASGMGVGFGADRFEIVRNRRGEVRKVILLDVNGAKTRDNISTTEIGDAIGKQYINLWADAIDLAKGTDLSQYNRGE